MVAVGPTVEGFGVRLTRPFERVGGFAINRRRA